MDFVPGQNLEQVWSQLTDADRKSIKKQLGEQILLLRKCTLDYIGRAGSEKFFRDPCTPSCQVFCGPFASEEEFDSHKVRSLAKRNKSKSEELERKLQALRRSSPSTRFVLTHGDLCAHNIMVQNIARSGSANWQITGVIDWETSGFYPEYMEYAMAVTHVAHRHEWRMFIKETLEEIGLGCSVERLRAEAMSIDYTFGQPYFP